MAIIKLNAVITVHLENLLPDNPFVVALNHPMLHSKPAAVVIMVQDLIAVLLRRRMLMLTAPHLQIHVVKNGKMQDMLLLLQVVVR